MKTSISLPTNSFNTTLFALFFVLIMGVSCSKEYSNESPPPVYTYYSIFTTQLPTRQTVNDHVLGGLEIGVKFQTAVAGDITGIKFYKTAGNDGTHTAQLYTANGTLLASEISKNETDSGWQTVLFATAVPITADKTYIAAYHSSLGNYISTNYMFKKALTNGPLTALADSTEGINGLFKYTNTPAVPNHIKAATIGWML
jgi:hypothetical protein